MEDVALPTAAEVEEALAPDVELPEEWTPEEKAIAGKVLPFVARKANVLAEAKKGKELETTLADIRRENEASIKKAIDDMRKANEPLSSEEVGKLLNQEYLEFTIKLKASGVEREFVIRELTVKKEKKVLDAIKKVLVVRLKEIASIEWKTESSNIQKIMQLVEMIPDTLDVLADCCAVCLNPEGEDAAVDKEWVLENMNTFRMTAVLQAQAQASRWRDFILLASQSIPGL